jgi:hypothetical protein
MSLIVYPSGLVKPSNIEPLPDVFIRPAFEELYGFDVPQVIGIDGAVTTEASEPLTTELNEILLFEPTA